MKTIMITGGGNGIGKCTAELLASEGNQIVLCDLNEERLKNAEKEFLDKGYEVSIFKCDVTKLEDMQAAAAFTKEKYGVIDVIINNAGIMPLSYLRSLLVDEWNAMIDVNIRGLLNGIAAVLPIMREQGFGHILATSSIAGIKVMPTSAVYCATKYAVNVIMEGLRQEETPSSNIRSTVVYPGNVNTNLVDSISVPELRKMNTDNLAQAQEPINIARAFAYAINQPEGVSVNEIVVRPNALPF